MSSKRSTMRDTMGDTVRHTMRDTVRDAVRDDIMNHRVRHDLVDHRGGVDGLGMPGLALVADLHHGAAIAAIRGVGHVLDPAVREGHAVLALDVTLGIPGPGMP